MKIISGCPREPVVRVLKISEPIFDRFDFKTLVFISTFIKKPLKQLLKFQVNHSRPVSLDTLIIKRSMPHTECDISYNAYMFNQALSRIVKSLVSHFIFQDESFIFPRQVFIVDISFS